MSEIMKTCAVALAGLAIALYVGYVLSRPGSLSWRSLKINVSSVSLVDPASWAYALVPTAAILIIGWLYLEPHSTLGRETRTSRAEMLQRIYRDIGAGFPMKNSEGVSFDSVVEHVVRSTHDGAIYVKNHLTISGHYSASSSMAFIEVGSHEESELHPKIQMGNSSEDSSAGDSLREVPVSWVADKPEEILKKLESLNFEALCWSEAVEDHVHVSHLGIALPSVSEETSFLLEIDFDARQKKTCQESAWYVTPLDFGRAESIGKYTAILEWDTPMTPILGQIYKYGAWEDGITDKRALYAPITIPLTKTAGTQQPENCDFKIKAVEGKNGYKIELASLSKEAVVFLFSPDPS